MFVPRYPRFFKMYHRSTLEEAMKTIKEITTYEFNYLLEKFNYKFYSYDERIKAYRFIISDMDKNYNEPTWLLMKEV